MYTAYRVKTSKQKISGDPKSFNFLVHGAVQINRTVPSCERDFLCSQYKGFTKIY
jgi:hypothetical protein